ncbi:MAG: hypothetical protein HQK53_12800 [Oligoflexia bacterium]|nr:hypothetical protein [Oligoflexia bacterium]
MFSKKIFIVFSLILLIVGGFLVVDKRDITQSKSKSQNQTSKLAKQMKFFRSSLSDFVIANTHAAEQTMTEQFAQFARMFFFMIAGYPGVTETADALTVTDSSPFYTLNNRDDSPCTPTIGAANCDSGPPAGMLSLYNQIILGYHDPDWNGVAGVLASQGYRTCESIPTTSTDISPLASALTGSRTLTVTADTPIKVIPTGQTGAGSAYDRRLEVTFGESGLTHKFVVELKCQTAAQVADGKIQLYMAMAFTETTGTRYIEFYVDKNDLAAQKYQMFMKMDSTATGGDQLMGLNMNINGTANTFNYDMVMTSQDTATSYTGMRFNVAGDVTNDDFTLGLQNSGELTSFTAIAAAAGSTSTAVTHTFTSCNNCQGPPSDKYVVLCLRGDGTGTYSGPTNADILTGAACSGLSLTENTSAPAIDTNGTWSLAWVAGSTGLNAKIWDGNF